MISVQSEERYRFSVSHWNQTPPYSHPPVSGLLHGLSYALKSAQPTPLRIKSRLPGVYINLLLADGSPFIPSGRRVQNLLLGTLLRTYRWNLQ